MTGAVLVSFSRELHVCSRATFSKGQTFSQSLKGIKKKKKWARLGVVGEGCRCQCISVNLELHWSLFLLSFWKVGSHSGNQQSADVRAAGCNVHSVSEREELLDVSADTAL